MSANAMSPLDPASLSFRPCAPADLPNVFRWFHASHARRWFASRAATLEEVVDEYIPSLDGRVPIHVHVVLYEGEPIGMMEWCRMGDFVDMMRDYEVTDPDAVNCDVLIGEAWAIHRGLGASMVLRYLREVVYVGRPSLTACFIDPEVENVIAQRAYARAGFRFVREVRDEDGITIHLMVLDRAALEK